MSESMTIAIYEVDFVTDVPSVEIRAESAIFDHANDRLDFLAEGLTIKKLKLSEVSGWYIRETQGPVTTL